MAGNFNYCLSGNIGTITQEGVFTPTQTGTGIVSVDMQWRGFTIKKTIRLTVTSMKSIFVDNGEVSEIVLYACGDFNGKTYPTEQALSIKGFQDGVEKECGAEISDGADVAAFDNETNTVIALQGGTANLKISFTTDEGGIFNKNLRVMVKKHTLQKTIPLFSAVDGVGKGSENLQSLLGDETFLKAESSGSKLTIADGYKLMGLSVIGNSMSELKVNAESKSFIYELTLETYTKVLTEAQDFVDAFGADAEISGYYYLANDILPKQDGTYESMKPTKSVASTKAFKGTFDGAGHTVNLELASQNGLFTYLNAATIQNVRFNLRMAKNLGWLNSGLAHYAFNKNYLIDMYLNVENLSDKCNEFGAVARLCTGIINYKRVVIETPANLEAYNTEKMGAIASYINYIDGETGKETVSLGGELYADVYVIGSLPLAATCGKTYSAKQSWKVCAYNLIPDKNGDGKITADDIDVENKLTYYAQKDGSKKVYSYTDAVELISARHDLAAYGENGYWEISSGAPVWKGNN